MLILALETSGETASAAIVTEGKVIAEINFANKLTHSQTLMPILDFMLKTAEIELSAMDYIAFGAGPGSFTGLRIGAAAAKAVCYGAGKKLIPVPSLDALAYNAAGFPFAVPVMDARRGQVYSCVYESKNGEFIKLTPYLAEDLDFILENAARLSSGNGVIFLGDGSNVFCDRIVSYDKNYHIAPEHSRLQRAASVGLLALSRADEAVGYETNPVIYLRKPQAEREAEEKNA